MSKSKKVRTTLTPIGLCRKMIRNAKTEKEKKEWKERLDMMKKLAGSGKDRWIEKPDGSKRLKWIEKALGR